MNSELDLVLKMEEKHGPLIGGKCLYASLGFKTYSAFYKSLQLDEVGVNVFKIAGRKGWFALTEDVAHWINKQSVKK